MEESSGRQRLLGLFFVVLAFTIWGMFPIYFHLMEAAPPLVILAFRAFFTTLLILPLVLIRGKGPVILKTLRNRKYCLGLLLTSILICVNWGIFIWLVLRHKTLYASLANYVTPLFTVFLGFLFLKERLNRWSVSAIFLALIAAGIFACGIGRLPWESVACALSFGLYSLFRKMIPVDSLSALSIETIFSAPVALGYIFYAAENLPHPEVWNHGIILILLLGSGILTALPLIFYGSGMRRIDLTVVGTAHYITPTLQFLCAITVINEKMDLFQWISFLLVWLALAIFTWGTWRDETAKITG